MMRIQSLRSSCNTLTAGHLHSLEDAVLVSSPSAAFLNSSTSISALNRVTQTTPAMPSLKSLIIGQLSVHRRPFSLSDFPWKQLKRLALDTSPVSQCASIVSWCVQLEHIALTFGSCDSLPSVSIVSQTITSATLNWAEEGCEKLFSLLQFPQLHTLESECCHLPADSTYPFITYSPTITNLFLKDLRSNHGLLVLLGLLPTVTHLSFRNSWRQIQIKTLLDFFSKLHPTDPQSGTLLPRLTHFDMLLTVACVKTGPSLATAFVEMVKSRVTENWSEQQLKSVRFSVPNCCLNHELISSLAYLLKVGIAISIQDRCGFIL